MPAPWIEAWKAWLLRVAERFVPPAGPADEAAPQRVPPPKARAAGSTGPQRKSTPHRSGQRHG
jgi:hypothetical protein